ncbi:hypothetical protein [Paracoccus jiaweipingae]|uniref:hypothetical protein n=1 Tax=unclassified Paracoccus (in: a-proteobacteria) TaxID=2688777 RepID=UPI0037B02428
MVTSVTAMANAAPLPVAQGDAGGPALSDLAQRALTGLGQMHSDFAASAQAMQAQTAAPAGSPASAGSDLSLVQHMQAVQDSYRTAIQVQHQIMQFSMATSISQSLGNNLNSFLKGA